MASDWIKMRIDLDTDPGVVRISSATSADRYQTVGRLHKVWSWADCHSIDGKDIPVGADFVDSIVDCKGFAAAMASVGWLEITGDCVSFPHFERHNGESAKRRATDQKRKKNVRKVSAKCPQESGPEKRREEKNTTKVNLSSYAAKEAFDSFWKEYPKRVGKDAARKAFASACKRLAADGVGFPEQHIVTRTKAYGAARADADPKFTPHPATWLNAGRFDDDPSTWTEAAPRAGPAAKAAHRPTVHEILGLKA